MTRFGVGLMGAASCDKLEFGFVWSCSCVDLIPLNLSLAKRRRALFVDSFLEEAECPQQPFLIFKVMGWFHRHIRATE
jgi:hypothetical protein